MSARFSENQGCEVSIRLESLDTDLRRMLSIQFREFIHHIEDQEPDNSIEASPRVIRFLERCLRDAA